MLLIFIDCDFPVDPTILPIPDGMFVYVVDR